MIMNDDLNWSIYYSFILRFMVSITILKLHCLQIYETWKYLVLDILFFCRIHLGRVVVVTHNSTHRQSDKYHWESIIFYRKECKTYPLKIASQILSFDLTVIRFHWYSPENDQDIHVKLWNTKVKRILNIKY